MVDSYYSLEAPVIMPEVLWPGKFISLLDISFT